MQIIKKEKLSEFLKQLAQQGQVWVPHLVDGISRFVPWEAGMEPYLEQNTTVSPKEVLFPQSEVLYTYRGEGKDVEITPPAPPAGPAFVFGLRPCDVAGYAVLDEVFLTHDYVDPYYQARRENTVLLALACRRPQPWCFCTSFGIDPTRAQGADVMVYDLGDTWGLEPASDRGQELLVGLAGLESREAEPPAFEGSFSLAVDLAGLPEKLQAMFRHPVWDTLYQTCLGCGTCTFLCPTCHCFDMQGRNNGDAGYRYRCWDSCMFGDYNLVAGGANPRPTKKERVRNRFLHKLQFMPERYDKFGCVGCGRCVVSCPVNLDITRIVRRLQEVEIDGQ